MNSFPVFTDVLARAGLSVAKTAPSGETQEVVALLKPSGSRPMLRVGGVGDGSYLIPDDLQGVTHCFSPGVGSSSAFELDLARRGMGVFMTDASVRGPAAEHENFRFRGDYLASYSDPSRNLVSMEDWYAAELGGSDHGDLLLQMDIEGGEYEVIHSMSDNLLRKFRILAIEFHHLHQLRNCHQCRYMSSALHKLRRIFRVCYLAENFAAGSFVVGGQRHGRLMEVTFLRNDRWPSKEAESQRFFVP